MLNRAREEATDVAQVAKIKFDIRSLEGRRDHQLLEIGRKVYEDRNVARFAGVDPMIANIDELAQKIREKKQELEGVRARPATVAPSSDPAESTTG